MLQKEGQVRIPAGCAISGIFHKDGARENGTRIIDSIRTMHDRSNGLGGGFAGYGIYPEYADFYAFHVFYDTQNAKETCEKELERAFRHRQPLQDPDATAPPHQGRADDLALFRHPRCTPSSLPANWMSVSSSPALSSASTTRWTGPTSFPPARTWVCSRPTASRRT